MTGSLPPPVALADPPEDAGALAETLEAVSAAAFRLGVLEARLAGPAASAPGWIGADAAEAVAQIAAVTGLVRRSHAALTAAGTRLDLHARVLEGTRRRIEALRAAQEEDRAETVARAGGPTALPVPTGLPPSGDPAGIAEEWGAREARRVREHEALLAELARDGVATARVLAESSAVVGGTGGAGDADRVVLRLAAQLPGWGNVELATRARALAAALSGPGTAAEVDRLAGEAGGFAAAPAFAAALLAGLGSGGVRFLLSVLGSRADGAGSPLARVLAEAFGAARPSGVAGDPVGEALGATYVRADDADGAADVVELGMAAVLAGGGAPPVGTLVAWGSQFLARERAQGASSAQRVPAAGSVDPVAIVVGLLADRGEPAAAARLLASPDAWSVLLARGPGEGNAELAELTRLAGADAGPGGDTAVRAALHALGAGLSPRAPGAWTVDRATVAAVAPVLAAAVARRLPELTGTLRAVGEGASVPAGADAALRGLGYLTVDRAASRTIAGALRQWGAAALRSRDPLAPEAVATAFGAYAGVEQYGQRLAHALDAAAARDAAIDRALPVRMAELALCAVPGDAGILLSVVEPGAEVALGATGSWDASPRNAEADVGPLRGSGDAAGLVAALAPERAAPAGAAFERATAALGVPAVPVSPSPAGRDRVSTGLFDAALFAHVRGSRFR